MAAQKPEEVHELFVRYFNAGDIDSMISLYETTATMVPFPDPAVSGHNQIRAALEGFLALKGHMELSVDRTIHAPEIALIFSRWTLKGTGPDGKPLEIGGQTSDVVRRQADGTWLLVIDNPQGAAVATHK